MLECELFTGPFPSHFPPYVVNAQLEDHSSERMNGAASYRGTASNSFLWTTGHCRLRYVFVVVSYPAVHVLPSAQEKRCRMSDPSASIDAHVQASDELAVVTLAPLRLVLHCCTDMLPLCGTRVSLCQILLFATTRKPRVRQLV